MKKMLCILSSLFLSVSLLLPLTAEAKKQSFLHDRTKLYTHLFTEYTKNGKKLHKISYAFDQKSGYWKGGTDGEIKRNLKKGERIFTKTPGNMYFTGTVLKTNATVKTQAGTFKNCVWIAKERASLYYAPRHGIIKVTDEQGRIVKELVKVSKRR